MSISGSTPEASKGLSDFLALLRKDYSALKVRIRTVEHTVKSDHPAVTIRVHYPSLRGPQPTIGELIDLLVTYIVPFALTRKEWQAVKDQYGKVDSDEYDRMRDAIRKDAVDLFKKVSKKLNRNGEGGELLLYLLTEWILEAPQIIAKMPLKTNNNMAIHGSDGIHVKLCTATGKLMFLWGESKLWADVSAGIDDATKSIAEALSHHKLQHEFKLVSRNIDASGLSIEAKQELLSYLDPLNEKNNEWLNVTTCLICFDFEAYMKLTGNPSVDIETFLNNEITSMLPTIARKLSSSLKAKGLQNEIVEFFLFPIPSVQTFRDLFQTAIGWNS